MRHTIRQGECFSVLARRYGFASYKDLYHHPDNAELRKKRPNPNVLFPGDVVVIPEHGEKEVEVPTAKRSRFQMKRPRKALRLVLQDNEGDPLAGEAYELEIGLEKREGQTDGDGLLDERVPDDVPTATLTIAGRVLHLRLGALNPVKDAPDQGLSGVQARLANLGYSAEIDGERGARSRAALAMFQADVGLPITGELDDATRDALVKEHGC